MKPETKKRLVILGAVIGCVLLGVIIFYPRSYAKTFYKTGYCCDTVISLTIVGEDEAECRRILEEAYQMCLAFEADVLDRFSAESEVGRMNLQQSRLLDTGVASQKETYQISATLQALLEAGVHYGKLTQGAFDITIAPYSDLWNVTEEDFKVPSSSQIETVRSLVDIASVEISEGNVSLISRQQLDFGGLAKGFLCQKLYEFFKAEGVTKAVINFGGNVCIMGEGRVGIENPFGKDNIKTVELEQGYVSTAGIYERGVEVEGVWYHHIIDPRTGSPATGDVVSATVVTQEANAGMLADIISTTCVVLGREAALEFLDELWRQEPKLEQVILVLQDQSVVVWEPEGV